MAEIILRGHVFVKAMCGACQGLGKLETFNSKGFPEGAKFAKNVMELASVHIH